MWAKIPLTANFKMPKIPLTAVFKTAENTAYRKMFDSDGFKEVRNIRKSWEDERIMFRFYRAYITPYYIYARVKA